MWDDSDFGGGSFFDTNHDGHLDAFELDHAECFLHDCDTYDQVLEKEGYSAGHRSRSRGPRLRQFGSTTDSKDSSDVEEGYNIHPDFAKRTTQDADFDKRVRKYVILSFIAVIAFFLAIKGVKAYYAYQADKAVESRAELEVEVQAMDLSSYCDGPFEELHIAKTYFAEDYSQVTIEGILVGTEDMDHELVFNYINETFSQMQHDIDEIYKDSEYGTHVKREHVKNSRGKYVHDYKNTLNIKLHDSIYEYSLYSFYPPDQGENKTFMIEDVTNNVGESWFYRYTDASGNAIFKYYLHGESDAYYDIPSLS